MADALHGAAAPIPAAVRAAVPQTEIERASSYGNSPLARVMRLLALVEMAKDLPAGEPDFPGDGNSTDRDDRLAALLHCLQAELEAMHAEVTGDRMNGGAA